MEFALVKGKADRIQEYKQVFFDAPLYDAYFKDNAVLEKVLKQAIQAGALYVAVNEMGKAIGVMHMTMDGLGGLPYIHLLGVKNEYRGRGIGRALIQIFINVAETLCYSNMFIMTSDFNLPAQRLYMSMGFRPMCLLPDLFVQGVSEYLLMRKASNRT